MTKFLHLILITIILIKSTLSYLTEQFIEVDSQIELHHLLTKINSLTGVIYYSRTDTTTSIKVEKVFNKIEENFEGIVQFYKIDCQKIIASEHYDKIPVCQHEEKLPYASFYNPPEKEKDPITQEDNSPREYPFTEEITFSKLKHFILKIIPSNYVTLDSETFNKFLESKSTQIKVILFDDKKEPSPLFKALSTQFTSKIEFGIVYKNKKLSEQFDISTFPNILICNINTENSNDCNVYTGHKKFYEIKAHLAKLYKSIEQVDEKPLEQVNQLNLENFQSELLRNDKYALFHIKEKTGSSQEHWSRLVNKYQYLFNFYEFQVKDKEEENYLIKTLRIQQIIFPMMIYFPLAKNDQSKTKKQDIQYLDPNLSYKKMYKQIEASIDNPVFNVTEKNYKSYLESALTIEIPYLLYCYDELDDRGLTYFKILAQYQEYKQYLNFSAVYQPSSKKFHNSFKIDKTPKLLSFIGVSGQLGSGVSELKFDVTPKNLKGFLDNVVERFIKKHKIFALVTELKSQKTFEEQCQIGELCYIAFVNGENRKQDINNDESELMVTLSKLSKISEKHILKNKTTSINWVDGICYNDILNKLQIRQYELPVLIAYDMEKNTYIRMKKAFTPKHIEKFIRRSKKDANFQETTIKFIHEGCQEEGLEPNYKYTKKEDL